ncbi:hypothetical protein EJB05_38849, partial [Eragrostis curvula]
LGITRKQLPARYDSATPPPGLLPRAQISVSLCFSEGDEDDDRLRSGCFSTRHRNLSSGGMASTACFAIVSKNDIPIYEAELGSAPKKEDLSYHHQFILHAALDVVQDLAWTTSVIFCFVLQIFLNPLYLPGSRIASSHFDTKVRALARKYL